MCETPLPFLYAIHGLTISSDIPCSELQPGAGTPDVRLRYGTVPRHLDAPRAAGVLFEATRDSYLLCIDGIARYWARSGREIVVDPAPNATRADVHTFLFGSVFSALLHQRGGLVLHAGGAVGRRGAVLVAGHSGHGKSTVLAALAKRGYRILTDDAAAIVLDESDRLMVQSGSPQLMLWADAVAQLGHQAEPLSRVRPGIEKYTIDVRSQFKAGPQPLAALYVLETHGGNGVEVERVQHSACFDAVCAQTRNFRVVEGLGMQLAHFKIAAAIAARIPVSRVRRPSDRNSLDEIVTSVDEALQ